MSRYLIDVYLRLIYEHVDTSCFSRLKFAPLIIMLKGWKKNLHKRSICSALFVNLSKAFHSLPHDLLFGKLEAYGFGRNVAKLVSHLLNERKIQNQNQLSL